MDENLKHFRTLTFSQSRIPALDALEVFVPIGAEDDEELTELRRELDYLVEVEGDLKAPAWSKGNMIDMRGLGWTISI